MHFTRELPPRKDKNRGANNKTLCKSTMCYCVLLCIWLTFTCSCDSKRSTPKMESSCVDSKTAANFLASRENAQNEKIPIKSVRKAPS